MVNYIQYSGSIQLLTLSRQIWHVSTRLKGLNEIVKFQIVKFQIYKQNYL